MKCNNYFPLNMICDWTNCKHPFCYECIKYDIQNEILYDNKIPICIYDKCTELLLIYALRLIYNESNSTVDYNYISEKLALLHDRKSKFICNECNL